MLTEDDVMDTTAHNTALFAPKQLRELRRLCRQYGVARLELFGSHVTGMAGPDSDVDLLVRFRPLTGMGPADQYFGLKAALEELFGRRVDLLSAGSVRNPYLKRRISRQAVTLF
jgi:hypothetical protein